MKIYLFYPWGGCNNFFIAPPFFISFFGLAKREKVCYNGYTDEQSASWRKAIEVVKAG
jgi:hypothetical protein